jgi:very-short-patch-repair endonuclease
MELTSKLLVELQRRLKVGNRRGVHLNGIPANSRYKFDLNRLSFIDSILPQNFIKCLLSEQPLKFRISWKNNVPDLNSLFEEDQSQLIRITKSFENLINQTEAIESEKGINTFGFGFPMLIRRDQADNKLTVAPILIWSLRVRRTKEFNTWEITRSEEDPIYINEVLINHLNNDAKVEIEQVSSEVLEDGLIDKNELIEICANLIESLNGITSNNLRENFREKLSNILPIKDKKHYESLPLTSNNAFIEFGGLFSIFEVQKQNIIDDYDELLELKGSILELGDLENHTFQPLSSVETDPSQQGILNALGTTRNVLIQGPPGTGKSQSLTAILVNALENNRKTIVVCEKRTALEVLHKSLNQKGLNFQCVLIKDIVKDRKVVVDSVRDRIDNSSYRRYRYNFSKETLDQLINHTKSLTSSINSKHQKLDKKLIGDHSWTDVIGLLLGHLKADEEDKLIIEDRAFVFSLAEMKDIDLLLQKGQKLYKVYLPYKSLSFLNSARLVGDNPFQVEQHIKEDFKYYLNEKIKFNGLSNKYKAEYFKRRNLEFDKQTECLEALIDLKALLYKFKHTAENFHQYFLKIEKTELNTQILLIKSELVNLKTHIALCCQDPYFLDENKTNSFFFKISQLFNNRGKMLIKARTEVQQRFLALNDLLGKCNYITEFKFNQTLTKNIEEIKRLEANLEDLIQNSISPVEAFFNKLNLINPIPAKYKNNEAILLEEVVKEIVEALPKTSHQNEIQEEAECHVSETLRTCRDFKLTPAPSEGFKTIENIDLQTINANFNTTVEQEFAGLNLLSVADNTYQLTVVGELIGSAKSLNDRITADGWVRSLVDIADHKCFLQDIDKILIRNNNYFSHEQDLFTHEFAWWQFYNNLDINNKKLIKAVKPHINWAKSFLIYYLNAILINSGTTNLPVNDGEHAELSDSLKGFEKEQLKFINQFWYSKQIDATRGFELKNPNLSVENLYNKRSSNRFTRLSLRQIVQYDIDLFTTFFPIILTTPDVCCNLFKGKNGYFDIVMFDEASQLRLEDNLPAILKGKQIIVAGDEHQMPPSNYFSKIFDGTIEDEEDIEDDEPIKIDKDNLLLSCESLLDFANELNFEKKHLDFHYRSRHPFLIDFSNYAFYNQRLKPLPNNFEYNPIKYVQVQGTFSEHTNEIEAEMILSILENNIQRLPGGEYPTVGIATFNIAQRNLIKSKILERQKFSKYETFNEKIQELGLDDPKSNKSFIKNLENIQGDETDIIILSTTYGLGRDGKFAQRFGPINHTKGYKLLNVIITRARYKVYVCTSIPEEVFLNYKEHLITEGANNKKAVFFAYLAYAKAISENNWELKNSVLDALSINSNVGRKLDNLHSELESPFEEEVYHELIQHFDENKLIPQHQFAGFRIDIVYDTNIPGKPKIAIECDGAKFHSSQEAYLHDLYRQKILESHGFVFHRIWSTNWWRNPKRESANLISFIKSVEEIENHLINDEFLISNAFTHDVHVNNVTLNSTDMAQSIFANEPSTEISELFQQNHVRSTSKVNIKYLNTGKDIIIQLGKINETENPGIQKINIDSPLGTALIGSVVGDIVKIGNLDNYVQILKIFN